MAATETKAATPPKNLKTSVFIQLNGEYALAEPFTGQRFTPGVPVEVSEVTSWIQSQIDAGLMTQLG